MGIWILLIGIGIISMIVQTRFKNKFKKYSEMPLTSGLSGAEIAQKMLHDNQIYDVNVVSVEGQLTDHYNPADKTVNLSPEVYHGRSVAAAAVASHECGHAVQHATAYSWLQFRSAMVPIVNVSSKIVSFTLMIGVILAIWQQNYFLLQIGVAALAVTTVFSFITLPVEFDASKRALAWLNRANVTHSNPEHEGAQDALKWAAMTYVIAALSALVTLLYYASILLGRRD